MAKNPFCKQIQATKTLSYKAIVSGVGKARLFYNFGAFVSWW